jgi:RimJ/RimL family protein N-acetyltransferase
MLMEAKAIKNGVNHRECPALKIKARRLLLRLWRDEDLPALAKMNQDSRVMEFFPAILDRQQSASVAKKIRQQLDDQGWGFWAVEIPGEASFIGFTGLNKLSNDLPFALCISPGHSLRTHVLYRIENPFSTAAAGESEIEHQPKSAE